MVTTVYIGIPLLSMDHHGEFPAKRRKTFKLAGKIRRRTKLAGRIKPKIAKMSFYGPF